MAQENQPIIVVKKIKKVQGGHHGGSWKVAYADFVTAMMAFFMVMWLLGLDEGTRKAIEGYFAHPVGLQQGYASGSSPLATGNSPGEMRMPPLHMVTRAYERRRFEELREQIRTELNGSEGLGGLAAQVEVVLTEDGLRIELIEANDGELFFEFGSAQLKPAAVSTLRIIAAELQESSAPLVVEGHTDSAPFGRAGYTNWELSADRANAARHALETAGLRARRIQEIRGHADRHLRYPENPLDPANRRISILLPFSTPRPSLTESVASVAPDAV